MRILLVLAFSGAMIAGGCSEFKQPEPRNPSQIVGCYGASGAPTIEVGMTHLRVVNASISIPYTYEERKIGMVIRTSLEAETSNGQLTLEPGDDHLFRVSFQDGQPLITFAFGPAGEVVNYRLVPRGNCTA